MSVSEWMNELMNGFGIISVQQKKKGNWNIFSHGVQYFCESVNRSNQLAMECVICVICVIYCIPLQIFFKKTKTI